MLTSQSRQNSYADPKWRDMEFQVGDHFLLTILPIQGVNKFEKKGMLSLMFVGPFDILKRIVQVTNRLTLLLVLVGVHNIFYVSLLRKYILDSSHVHTYEDLMLDLKLSYED